METIDTPKQTECQSPGVVPDDSRDIDAVPRPVTFRLQDYPQPHLVPWHQHRRAQLLYASRGVIRVSTDQGIWIVPPHRAVWLPPATRHQVSSPAAVSLRNLYFDTDCFCGLPIECRVVTVSPLLRELIAQAVTFDPYYDEAGPAGRIMQVIVDQITMLPVAPMHLPMPEEARLRLIAQSLQRNPADNRSLQQWGKTVGASARTLARLFLIETGYTFGQWRQQVRLLVALQGLAEGRSVAQVAGDIGYEKNSAFIAMFKRSLGRTPARFFDDE